MLLVCGDHSMPRRRRLRRCLVACTLAGAAALAHGAATGGAAAPSLHHAAAVAGSRAPRKPAASLLTDAGGVCPLTGKRPGPAQPKLQNCRQYQALSCCNNSVARSTHSAAVSNFAKQYAACPGCVHNLAALQCAIPCSPLQQKFLTAAAAKGGGSPRPTVRLCLSFCVSLFRSCGDAVLGTNASVSDMYYAASELVTTARPAGGSDDNAAAADDDEVRAATHFCLDQFQYIPGIGAVVVKDASIGVEGAEPMCYGHTHLAEVLDTCDPFEDVRFWHVVGESMNPKHGGILLIVLLLILCAAGSVGYAMVLVRRKTRLLSERQIQRGGGAGGGGGRFGGLTRGGSASPPRLAWDDSAVDDNGADYGDTGAEEEDYTEDGERRPFLSQRRGRRDDADGDGV